MNRKERRFLERHSKTLAKQQGGQPAVGVPTYTPEALEFARREIYLADFIEKELHVPNASLLAPADLARIGRAVYASAEEDIITGAGGLMLNAQRVIQSYKPERLAEMGLTPAQAIERYIALTGKEQYRDGEIANALRNAASLLGPEKSFRLESEAGILYGFMLHVYPRDLTETPQILVNAVKKTLDSRSTGLKVPLDQLKIVCEYGPGMPGLKRIRDEVPYLSQYIGIEANQFTVDALISYAQLNGIKYPQVIGRRDGIRQATEEFLREGAAGFADAIIASMVFQFVNHKEMQAGIENGFNLLRKGGILAIQALNTTKPDQVSGQEVLELGRERFGEPIAFKEFKFTNPALRGETRSASTIFFRK